MTKKEKQTYLDKHKVAVSCGQICFASIYWWCGHRSPKHILKCEDFEPMKENKKGVLSYELIERNRRSFE